MAVSLEAGGLVHFKQPRFGVSIDQHVEAEHLEAHVEGTVVWLARTITVKQIRLHRDQRLDDQVGDFEL